MHDLVIRGGTVVDGTGRAKFTGDVAIDGATIAAVGGRAGPARREIDADGLLVTPGWVDIHTHYDGQATWDPVLAPSSWHGATTVLMGNCGVGFAPVRTADHTSVRALRRTRNPRAAPREARATVQTLPAPSVHPDLASPATLP